MTEGSWPNDVTSYHDSKRFAPKDELHVRRGMLSNDLNQYRDHRWRRMVCAISQM